AQPDRPAGRGLKLHAPPVAETARALGIPVIQPTKIRTPEFLAQIEEQRPDVALVIAYGRILPGPLLAIPKHGFLNVHASLLPAWRGAAPIQRAIEAGDRITGVTIMRVDEELDHGPMLAVATTEIGPDERTPSLFERLSHLGAEALLPVLRNLERGTAIETEQDHASATIAPKIEKSEGLVELTEAAATIYDRFRAFDPWPGLWIETAGETLKLTELRPVEGSGAPRTVLAIHEGVTVATGAGAIRIDALQRPGKPRAEAAAVARGLGWRVGERVP
ncbi:MAG: methionyl-tRNA formyltransferase, partial [Thermoanaerobaculia bacterium]